jgi:3-hydroxyisobutyrate dehydrogenase
MSQPTVGIVGVGLMGHGIASNVQKSGRPIAYLAHDGNQPTTDLDAQGAASFDTCAQLAANCDVIIICVTGSPQVEQVLTQPAGLLEGLQPGTTIIDCSTAIPSSTQRLADAVHQAGGKFLDAPMTRTPKEAAEGRLNLIVGGDPAIFDAQKPLLQTYAENITYAGAVGAGHTMKLLHNYVSLGFSAVLSEAIAASAKAGVEPTDFLAVLAKGAGAGVVLDRISPFVTENNPSSLAFSLANSSKDMGYYNAMCDDVGASSGVSHAVLEVFEQQVQQGNGDKFLPMLIDLLGSGK